MSMQVSRSSKVSNDDYYCMYCVPYMDISISDKCRFLCFRSENVR